MSTNKLAGILLIVFGVLLAGASGLCCLAFLSEDGPNAMTLENGIPQVLLIFGGVPFTFGLMAILGGVLALRNDARKGGK